MRASRSICWSHVIMHQIFNFMRGILHLFISHFFRPIRSKHTTVWHTEYWFMHHLQADNKINLLALIFQDLIKIVRGNIKIIPYGMRLSYLIRRMGSMLRLTRHFISPSIHHLQAYFWDVCNTSRMPKVIMWRNKARSQSSPSQRDSQMMSRDSSSGSSSSSSSCTKCTAHFTSQASKFEGVYCWSFRPDWWKARTSGDQDRCHVWWDSRDPSCCACHPDYSDIVLLNLCICYFLSIS